MHSQIAADTPTLTRKKAGGGECTSANTHMQIFNVPLMCNELFSTGTAAQQALVSQESLKRPL